MEWYFFAIIAAIFFGGRMILEKRALFEEHALEMSTILSIFIFFLFFVFFDKVNFSISADLALLIFFSSILATFAFLFLAKGIRHMDVSITAPLLNFSPAFVALLAYFFLNERLEQLQFFGICLLIIGAYFLEVEKPFKNPLRPIVHLFKSKYTQYIFLSMLLYSFVSILDKVILGKTDQFTYLFFVQFFIMINFIFLINLLHDGFKGIGNGIKRAGKWVFFLAILFIIQRTAYLTAVSMVAVSLAFPIYRVGTLFSTLLGGQIFHDKHLIHRAMACTIMVVGAVFVVL
jgi:drug/metabolite transporter (DMT)-like permease